MISLWLTFSNITGKFLKREIQRLAAEYSTPVFIPHITIYGSLPATAESVVTQLDQKLHRPTVFSVQPGPLDHSTHHWQSVMVRLPEQEELMVLHQQLTAIFGELKQYRFDPHVSLIYGDLTLEEREAIIATVQVPLKLKVQSLEVCQTTGDPEHWQILKTYKFIN